MNDSSSNCVVSGDIETLLPSEVRRIIEKTPVAYIPIGPIEWHGEHLPLGVDPLIAGGLLRRVAEKAGGVILPAMHISCGLLNFPFSLSDSQQALDRAIRHTVEQVYKEGFKCIVVLTGHGPMDQIHTIKSACEDLMTQHPDCRAFGLCWFELLVDSEEELIIDHAAKVETSLMQALCPSLVDLSKLSDDPEEIPKGVYGKNPKFTASPEWGSRMVDHFVKNLTDRVGLMLKGEQVDNYADLRDFVATRWSKPLEPTAYRLTEDGMEFDLFNDSIYSRYISGVSELQIGGQNVVTENVTLKNSNPGESGMEQAANLSPLRGFYIRRFQCGTFEIKGIRLKDEKPHLRMKLQLAGVVDTIVEGYLYS